MGKNESKLAFDASKAPAFEPKWEEEPVYEDGRLARGQRRRAAMLAAARELFLSKGYRKTTLTDIIERSGGSRETIYSNFKGKIGLFGAIIDGAGDQFADFVLQSSSEASNPREFLTELGTHMLNIWLTPEGRAIHGTVLSEGVASPEIVDVWFRGGAEKVLKALAQYIEVQTKAGRLNVQDPMIMARQFQFLLYGEIAFPAMSGDSEPIDVAVAVKRTVDALLLGVEPT